VFRTASVPAMGDAGTDQRGDSRGSVQQRPNLAVAVLVACAALGVYRLDTNHVRVDDNIPAELLPISILTERNLDFDEFRPRVKQAKIEDLYIFEQVKGRVISYYSIVPGLLNVPAHVVARAAGLDTVAESAMLARWTSSVIAALSVFFMTLTLQAICKRTATAVLFGAFYAFATCTWSVAATGLWQQGPSLLFLTAGFAGLCSADRRWIFASGLMLAMAVWTRPLNATFALASAAYVLIYRRDGTSWLLAGAALPAVLMASYSVTHWGSLWALGQGHRIVGSHGIHQIGLVGPLLPNLAGTLVSPNRGLFVFTPAFLLTIPTLGQLLRRPGSQPFVFLLTLATLAHLLLAALWTVWWGGDSFGYRLLMEMIPGLTLLLALAWEQWIARHWASIALFFVLVAGSTYIHFLGAVYYPSGWNDRPVSVDEQPERLWDWRDTELSRLQNRFLATLPWRSS